MTSLDTATTTRSDASHQSNSSGFDSYDACSYGGQNIFANLTLQVALHRQGFSESGRLASSQGTASSRRPKPPSLHSGLRNGMKSFVGSLCQKGRRENLSEPGQAQPSLTKAWTQHRPDHVNPGHFSAMCFTWFEAEAGFRIEIWTCQDRQIVRISIHV